MIYTILLVIIVIILYVLIKLPGQGYFNSIREWKNKSKKKILDIPFFRPEF